MNRSSLMCFPRWIFFGIFTALFTFVSAQAADVIALKMKSKKAPQILEFVVAYDQTNPDAVFKILTPAIVSLIGASSPDLTVKRGSKGFDFIIDISSSQLAESEMASHLTPAEAKSVKFYTFFDSHFDRWVVRLLWDRLTDARNVHGQRMDHPRALALVVTALTHEVFGALPIRLEKGFAKSGNLSASGRRDAYFASAAALDRLAARPSFENLSESEQKQILEAHAAELAEASTWSQIVSRDSGQFVTSELKPKIVSLFEGRCEALFTPKP